MTGKLNGYFGVAAAGTIAIYPVKTVTSSGKGGPSELRVKISQKGVPFDLPLIPADKFAPAIIEAIAARAEGTAHVDLPGSKGVWLLRAPHTLTKNMSCFENWHAMVEAETNPPYQPFHTDRRVSLLAFAEPSIAPPRVPYKDSPAEEFEQYDLDRQDYSHDILIPHVREAHHIGDDGQWLFGKDIRGARTILEGGTGSSDDLEMYSDDSIQNQVEMQEGKLVMTTVRRKTREDEEFFEDGAEIVDFADNRV